MKKIVFAFFFSLSTLCASSQVHFGLSAGTVYAMADDLPFNGYGYHAGVSTVIPIAEKWSFVPEIRLVAIEYQKHYTVNEIKLIELPLSLEHEVKLKENKYFKLIFGAFGNLNVAGTRTYFYDEKIEDGNVVVPAYQKSSSLPKTLGGGVLFGFGFEINRFYIGLEPNFRYYEPLGAGVSINTKLIYRFRASQGR